MTKTVYLLRHAKSDWSDLTISDHDRRLNSRGEKASSLIGHKLREMCVSPDTVICSTALRTKLTLNRIMDAGNFNWDPLYKRSLYAAGADRLLTEIHGLPEDQKSVLLVGHNPGIQDLALALAGETDKSTKKRLRKKVPTGAFIRLDFDVNCFKRVAVGRGKLLYFMRPKHEFLQ